MDIMIYDLSGSWEIGEEQQHNMERGLGAE